MNISIQSIDTQAILDKETLTITEDEKKYYKPDSYYKAFAYPGTEFEKRVITFEERKATMIPSSNGLYIPEILMLHFCGKYPHPKSGYPGYWWYQYGIRNVGSVFESLVSRGFLQINQKRQKYELTALGREELDENQYVPYMHQNCKSNDFTVWDLNILLGNSDKSNYMQIVNERMSVISNEQAANQEKYIEGLKAIRPDLAQKAIAQTEQLENIKNAAAKFTEDKDIEQYISFWENLWENGGLLFPGLYWAFMLPSLYIDVQRYDEAIAFCERLKMQQEGYYVDKAEKYLSRINALKIKKEKKQAKNKKHD